MSKLIKTYAAEYSLWIQELKERYRHSQIIAAVQVNCEILRFNWLLGRGIVARDAENVYGTGFYRNLSQNLKEAILEAEFLRLILRYINKMYLVYTEFPTNCTQAIDNPETEICPQVVDDFIFSIHGGVSDYERQIFQK